MYEECNSHQCVDCEGVWISSNCDKPCGGGNMKRLFHITQPAGPGGKSCKAEDGWVEDVPCNLHSCVDCVGKWEFSDSCSKQCGGGELTRTFKITQQSGFGGKTCEARDGEHKKY